MPSTSRLIKKYPNRRLYDTQTSAYITLADVKQLVLESEDFKVLDAKSGEDLTRSILLQISWRRRRAVRRCSRPSCCRRSSGFTVTRCRA